MRILGAALGNCIHVAGISNFLELAGSLGYETRFMGPAVPVSDIVDAALEWGPDIIDIGYRLGPGVAVHLATELVSALDTAGVHCILVFGGPPPVCRAVAALGRFTALYDGLEGPGEPLAFLKSLLTGETPGTPGPGSHPGTLVERLEGQSPVPLIRHHFGLPDYRETLEGVAMIAESGVLDIISIGPDQNAQEHFFNPHLMDEGLAGAGGVPIRSRGQLEGLYAASRRGNHPLMRCYSGTNDQLRWAGMLRDTMDNAWAAIPLFWYSELDGRSRRPLPQAIRENIGAIRWHAERGIPVEVNDPHHWSLRDSHDAMAVAVAYIAALNARAQGVRTYVAQFMLNTPVGTSFTADLGKMLAKLDLLSELEDDGFRVLRQTRAGLMSFTPDPDTAKGQLAASVLQGLMLRPDIVHVVGFPEADHAATARDVIESCKIARGVMRNCGSLPDPGLDPGVSSIRKRLVGEAKEILSHIGPDSLTDPDALARAVASGVLDSPQFKATGFSKGALQTRMMGGCCHAVNAVTGQPMTEAERLRTLA